MVDRELFLMFMLIGAGAGITIVELVGVLAFFLGAFYHAWHCGRELAQLVTEKTHKRRVELLAKMIELERVMQPDTSKTQSLQVRSG
jgi:hypothetical protein